MNARPPIPCITKMECRALLRKERWRIRFDAGVSLILTLGMGWTYAQITRGMGFAPHWIGATAVLVQFITFTLGMWLRPSDFCMKRKPI